MSRFLSVATLAFALVCLCSTVSLSEARKRAFHKGGFSVELIHRDSSKSPFYHSTETHFQRVANAIGRSTTCATQLASTQTPQTDIIPNQGEFLMGYSVGTPPFQILGIVDTGSNIIWFQCKPCETCSNQSFPLFDPSKSQSYKTVPCDTDTCNSLRNSFCSGSGDEETCQYSISYGDGSHSQGPLSLDTLTLGSTDGNSIQFPKTVMGCGTDNTMRFVGNNSGIVGLSGGSLSLVNQLGDAIQGKFSYCLVPMFSQSNLSSKLNFGDNAIVSGGGTVSSPIVPPNDQQSSIFYYLHLEGFSVGDTKVDFGSPSSQPAGNIIIDSGTTLTLLPPDVYSNLESAVAEQVKHTRVQDPTQQLSLCYQVDSSENLEVPVITAHFTGGDIKLNPLNTFVQLSQTISCLAFTASETLSIFGNVAQQNLLVGYDIQNKLINFKSTDCTKQ